MSYVLTIVATAIKAMNKAVKFGQNIHNLPKIVQTLSTVQDLLKKIQGELLGLPLEH